MAVEQTREATLGILTYLLLGAALGAGTLLGTFVLGAEPVREAVSGGLGDAAADGSAFPFLLYAFFVFAPLLGILVGAIMGMRAARTNHPIGGMAAATTLYGIPLLWVNLAIALLLSSALLDWLNDSALFDAVFDLVVQSIIWLVLATGAAVGFAALIAGVTRDAFLVPADHTRAARERTELLAPKPRPGPAALPEVPETSMRTTPSASPSAAPPEPRTPVSGTYLEDYPVECPRCHANFAVSGERPLRIECPECGKTGTIR